MRIALLRSTSRSRKLRLRQRDSLISLSYIRKLAGIHQLDRMVVGQCLGRLGSNCGGLFPLMRIAIRVDLTRITSLDIVAAKGHQLLISGDSLCRFVLFAIDDCEAIEKIRTVRLVAIGVLSIRVSSVSYQFGQYTNRVVITAQRIVDESFVIGQFE